MIIERIGKTERAFLAYIAANILSKGVNFITIPIFTRLLSTSEMGVIATFSSWQTILYTIVSLGLVTGSFSVAMVTYEKQRDRYMSVTLFASTVSAFAFLIIALLISDQWEKATSLPFEILWVMVIYMFLQPAMDLWYARKRYENEYKSVFLVSVTSTILSAVTSIVAVIIISELYRGYNLGTVKIIAQSSVMFIFSAVFYVLIFITGRSVFDKKMLSFSIALSLPLVVHSLSKNILDISDRIMIADICGQSDAGIYGTIYTISLMALIIWNAVNSALVPEMFENLKNKRFIETERKIYKLIIIFGGVSITVTLLSPEVVGILTTNEYYGALHLIPPLFASVFLSSVYNIYGNFLLYKRCTIQIMIATVIAAVFNVGMNYIFIRMFGYVAAAYTTLASAVLLSLGQGVMQNIVFKERVISHRKIAVIGIGGTIGCLSSSFLWDFVIIKYIFIIILILKLLNDVMCVLIKNDNTVV